MLTNQALMVFSIIVPIVCGGIVLAMKILFPKPKPPQPHVERFRIQHEDVTVDVTVRVQRRN